MEFEVAGDVVHPESGEELLVPAGAIHFTRNIGTTLAVRRGANKLSRRLNAGNYGCSSDLHGNRFAEVGPDLTPYHHY